MYSKLYCGKVTKYDPVSKEGYVNRINNPYARDLILSKDQFQVDQFNSLKLDDKVIYRMKTIKNRRHAIILKVLHDNHVW